MLDEGKSPGGAPSPVEEPRDDFRIEDERWAAHRQRSDWMWLAVMILVYSAWTLIVYLLEPGLR
jgi:hypothetical protein